MQNNISERKNLLTIGEASEYLGVSIDTLRRWEKRGRIEPFRSPGGHRHYIKEELDKLFDKKYVRDEPTIRRSLKDNTDDKAITSEDTRTDKAVPEEPVTAAPPPPKSPLIGIPAWRTFESADDYIKAEDDRADEKFQTLDRPSREIKIPEVSRIKVIREETMLTPEEAYFRQQSISILTPDNTDERIQNLNTPQTLIPEPEVRQSAAGAAQDTVLKSFQPIKADIGQDNELITFDKKTIIYIVFFSGLIILAVTWYFSWVSSQRVLSPIP